MKSIVWIKLSLVLFTEYRKGFKQISTLQENSVNSYKKVSHLEKGKPRLIEKNDVSLSQPKKKAKQTPNTFLKVYFSNILKVTLYAKHIFPEFLLGSNNGDHLPTTAHLCVIKPEL